jgi:hypothetical protein
MVWKCHAGCGEGGLLDFEEQFSACDRETAHANIADLLGLQDNFYSMHPPAAIYDYVDEARRLLYQKLRFVPKRFLQRKPDGERSWKYELGNVRQVLYNLPALITANQVLVVEGEKDADNINRLDLARLDSTGFTRCAATTNVGGAGKWSHKFAPYFTGKAVVILPDNDKTGRDHALTVAESIYHYAQSVRVVELPGLAEHGDVSDFLTAHSGADLIRLVSEAPLWHPPASPLLVPAPVFLQSTSDEIDWLVDGIIQRGSNGFIVSDPKVGKSYLVVDLALSLAFGIPWMEFTSSQAKVALISREDNPELTKHRMRRLIRGKQQNEQDLMEWLYVNSKDQSPEFKIDKPDQMAEMMTALRAFGPQFVILDVLNKLHSADENDQTEMRSVLDCADQMHRELNCSICVLHHFNKQEKGRLTHRMRGSSAIAGWAEWIIGLEFASADQQERIRTMEFELKACAPHDIIYYLFDGEGDDPHTLIRRTESPERNRGSRSQTVN